MKNETFDLMKNETFNLMKNETFDFRHKLVNKL